MADFDSAPQLEGQRLSLRPLVAQDRAALRAAASDPRIWEQHPARQRHKAAVFDPYFDFLLQAGGTLIVTHRAQEQVIGCSRFYTVPDQPGDWAIGFTFLSVDFWGGDWNRELKSLMTTHAFAQLPRLWFHIAPDNIRSQVATTRLGARYVYDADLDLGTGPVPTKCYRLTQAD